MVGSGNARAVQSRKIEGLGLEESSEITGPTILWTYEYVSIEKDSSANLSIPCEECTYGSAFLGSIIQRTLKWVCRV